MIVSLIGLPGSGKTTVGKQLSRRLGFSLFDSDQVIEKKLGSSIKSYFASYGEERFRDFESQVVSELLNQDGQFVLSTGGGVVLRECNRSLLRQKSLVFYLRSKPDALIVRLRHDTSRPLLQVADPKSVLAELYKTRDPLYQMTAHYSFDTGRLSMAALVNRMVMQYEMESGRANHG